MATYGINLLQMTSWAACRPFRNEALHGRWPEIGSIGGPIATGNYVPGVTYKAMLTEGQSMDPGVYRYECNFPLTATLTPGGDFVPVGPGKFSLAASAGPSNGWLDITVGTTVPVSSLILRVYHDIGMGPPSTVHKKQFTDKLEPFLGCVRLMDWCGAFSQRQDPLPTTSYTASSVPVMDRHAGVVPRYLHIPRARRVWLNPPLPIARDKTSLVAWLNSVIAYADPMTDFFISPSNELWNDAFPQSQFLKNAAASEPGSGVTNRAVVLSRWCLDMKSWVLGAGLGDRVTVVMEWWAAQSGLFPFSSPSWNGGPISPEARANLLRIGHVAIAPYFGHSGAGNLAESVASSLGDLRAWRDECEDIGVTLHCYEAGQHLTQNAGMHQEDPEMLAAYEDYLDGVERLLPEDESMVCLYGFCGSWVPGGAWGLYRDLDDQNLKAQAVLNWMQDWGKFERTVVVPIVTQPTSGGLVEENAKLRARVSRLQDQIDAARAALAPESDAG